MRSSELWIPKLNNKTSNNGSLDVIFLGKSALFFFLLAYICIFRFIFMIFMTIFWKTQLNLQFHLSGLKVEEGQFGFEAKTPLNPSKSRTILTTPLHLGTVRVNPGIKW
jgi:hypothetical protein